MGNNGRLSGFHESVDDVVRALKAVHPHAGKNINGKLGKFELPIKLVTAFLIGERGKRQKSMFAMGVDYFGTLQKFYSTVLKLPNFRLTHIAGPRSFKMFKKHLAVRGSMYWDDRETKEVGDLKLGGGVVLCSDKAGAKAVNLEEMKAKLKQKYARR